MDIDDLRGEYFMMKIGAIGILMDPVPPTGVKTSFYIIPDASKAVC